MFVGNIKRLAKENTNFRKVLYTGKHSQIVAMSIPPASDIGEEVHPNTDQIFFIIDGKAQAVFNGDARALEEQEIIFVSAGTLHNIINSGDEDLKLITTYSPPHHADGTVHRTKAEADAVDYE